MRWTLLLLSAFCGGGLCSGGAGLERPPLAEVEEERGGWLGEAARRAQRSFADCRRKTGAFKSLDEDLFVSAVRIKNCLKENFLRSLDQAIEEKELPLTPFVTIIREEDLSQLKIGDARDDMYNDDIITSVYKRFTRILDTHSFKFNFSQLWTNSQSSQEFEDEGEEKDSDEGGEDIEEHETPRSWKRLSRQGLRRRRQQYRKAFPMMVAGYMMMSAFLVPLGFQFMAMIGGKALLLAKMAFFMSLFSGYKRLTNDLEYHHHPAVSGHHHDYLHHYPAFHHRSSHEAPGGQGVFSQIPGMSAAFSQLGGQFGHRRYG